MANFQIPDQIDIWDAENVFYLKGPISRIGKLLAHYELYKRIAHLPGAVVECGVYKGASLARFASFRSLLENSYSRPIIGFDAFGKFPTVGLASAADLGFVKDFESAGGEGISAERLDQLLRAKECSNYQLVQGNVNDTVPAFLRTNPHLRIALLHLDLDVYEPTRSCIRHFLPRIVKGGLIVFDDYNSVEGATRAGDELCAEHGLTLQKLPFYNVPSFVEVPVTYGGDV